MNKLLTTITLLCFSVDGIATDRFDLTTGKLLIPEVLVSDGTQITKSILGTNASATVKDVISLGESYSGTSGTERLKPDFYKNLNLIFTTPFVGHYISRNYQ